MRFSEDKFVDQLIWTGIIIAILVGVPRLFDVVARLLSRLFSRSKIKTSVPAKTLVTKSDPPPIQPSPPIAIETAEVKNRMQSHPDFAALKQMAAGSGLSGDDVVNIIAGVVGKNKSKEANRSDGMSRCLYWVCPVCDSGYNKDRHLSGWRNALSLQDIGSVAPIGTRTCQCGTTVNVADIYRGKYDLPRNRWSEVTGPVEVPPGN